MKTILGVIFGGRSGEHEISIRSAKTVIEQADAAKYDLVPLAITDQGQWLSPADSLAMLPESTQQIYRERHGEPETARTDGGRNQIAASVLGEQFASLDVIFPVLHG